MKKILIISLAIFLSGCAAQQAANSIMTDCADSKGGTNAACAKNHPSFAKLPAADQRAVTYRIMLNEQVASKQITQAQSDYLMQEYQAKIANEAQAINNANSQASSNAMMNTGAALMMMDAANKPRQTNTSCNTFMGTMNCRSY